MATLSDKMGEAVQSTLGTVVASSTPRFSIQAARQAAKESFSNIGNGVLEGFDELSGSMRKAGIYIGAAIGGLLICIGMIVGAAILEVRLRKPKE